MSAVVIEFGKSDPYVRELVEAWPPLTAEQRLHLGAVLLADLPDADRFEGRGQLPLAEDVAA